MINKIHEILEEINHNNGTAYVASDDEIQTIIGLCNGDIRQTISEYLGELINEKECKFCGKELSTPRGYCNIRCLKGDMN